MNVYRYTYEVTETRTATVECESESGARQHWIECADDIDANGSELVETTNLKLIDVDLIDEDIDGDEAEHDYRRGRYVDGQFVEDETGIVHIWTHACGQPSCTYGCGEAWVPVVDEDGEPNVPDASAIHIALGGEAASLGGAE